MNIYNFGENEGTNSFFLNEVSYKDSEQNIPKIEKISTTTIDIFCKENNITLLRTIGVIFSDEEKRITEYIN